MEDNSLKNSAKEGHGEMLTREVSVPFFKTHVEQEKGNEIALSNAAVCCHWPYILTISQLDFGLSPDAGQASARLGSKLQVVKCDSGSCAATVHCGLGRFSSYTGKRLRFFPASFSPGQLQLRTIRAPALIS
jgi:hypothetical protein